MLKDAAFGGSISVALGGDRSCATNGFWSALTVATTVRLPVLFYIDDNGYSISVPSQFQTPGGNTAANLRAFSNLRVLDGDGTDPYAVAALVERAVVHVRGDLGPVLLRMSVPRLCGHSLQDTQAYKPADLLELERQRDPLARLEAAMVPSVLSAADWLETAQRAMLDAAWARRPYPGDDYLLPFGKARLLQRRTQITVVSWGAMLERCEQAAAAALVGVELIDLRTLSPWDREAVLTSVHKTHRCLIVHEDTLTAGFGAEIAAVLCQEAFLDLAAPVERLTMPDIPCPNSLLLLESALLGVTTISTAIGRIAGY